MKFYLIWNICFYRKTVYRLKDTVTNVITEVMSNE